MEHAQGWFCDAGFQFASAGALGHGVSRFVSCTAIWGGKGGVPYSRLVCSSPRRARLNVPIVPGAAIGTRPGLPGQGPGPRGLRGREGGEIGGEKEGIRNQEQGFEVGNVTVQKGGLKARGKMWPAPLPAIFWHPKGHFAKGTVKK